MKLRVVVLLQRWLHPPASALASAAGALSPCEAAALTAGLAVRDATAGTCTALCAGDRSHDRALEVALAAGADRGVRVFDQALAQSGYLELARVLAAAAEHLGFDLVLCGERSGGHGRGLVGPAVAEQLDLPHLVGARQIGLAGEEIVCHWRGAGLAWTVRCRLPTVLCVGEGEDGWPAFRAGLSGSEIGDRAIDVLSIADLGLAAEELRPRRVLHRQPWLRPPRPPARLCASASELVAGLRAAGLNGGKGGQAEE
jgi:electron transfer flavoprotein beta subunit